MNGDGDSTYANKMKHLSKSCQIISSTDDELAIFHGKRQRLEGSRPIAVTKEKEEMAY